MRKTLIAALAVAGFGAALTPVNAAPLPAQPGVHVDGAVENVQFRRTYRYNRFGQPVVVDRYRGSGYGYGYGRPYYRRDRGNAAAAGIAGLAAGALIGGAIASQQAQPQAVAPSDDYVAYCSQRYRSFDPASGTFLGNDGRRRVCQYP